MLQARRREFLVDVYRDHKVRTAVTYAALLLGAVCTYLTVVAVVASWKENVRSLQYWGSDVVRITFLCIALMLLTNSVSWLSPDRSVLVGPATLAPSELVKSSVVIAIHCSAVAASMALVAVVGLAVKPIVRNAAVPSILTSLDILLLPCFKVYMYFALRELLWAQRVANISLASGGALSDATAALASATLAQDAAALLPSPPARLFFPPWLVPWAFWTLTPLCFSALVASRLVTDRAAAAPVLFALAFALNVPLSLQASSMFSALQQDARWPSIRAIARSTQLATLIATVVSLTLDALYQFAPAALDPRFSPLVVDAIVCAAQLPLVFLGVTSNGIVDKFWRTERAEVLNALATAHATVADSRQDLLRWLAHETRVPLNSLYMGLQLLNHPRSAVMCALPPGHDELTTLGHCRSAAEALISVLSDVLDLSKMDERGVRLRLSASTVGALLRDAVGQMEMMGREHGVALVAEVDGLSLTTDPLAAAAATAAATAASAATEAASQQPVDERKTGTDSAAAAGATDVPPAAERPLLFDRPHVTQVVVNFISNAVKFSPRGSSIRVSARILSSEVVQKQLEPEPRKRQPAPVTAAAASAASTRGSVTSSTWGLYKKPAASTADPEAHPAPTAPEPELGRAMVQRKSPLWRSSAATAAAALRASDPRSVSLFSVSVEGEPAVLEASAAAASSAPGGVRRRSVSDVSAASDSTFPIRRMIGRVDAARFAGIVQSQVRGGRRRSGGGATDASSVEIVTLEFAVADAGCGLSQSDAEHLFEAFQQVDAGLESSAYKGRSTGLGLAISRRLAAAHCGAIGLRSGPSAGSVFFLQVPAAVPPRSSRGSEASVRAFSVESQGSAQLPFARAASGPAWDAVSRSRYQAENKAGAGGDAISVPFPPATASPAPASAAVSAPADRRTLRVLLVDDSAVNRRMLSRSLLVALPADVALEIVEVSDGAEGLRAVLGAHAGATGATAVHREQLATAPSQPDPLALNLGAISGATGGFDLCLCDAEMPVMNGYDMVAALRRAGSPLPVIGVTGNALPEDVRRFLDAGAQAVVTKPVRMHEMLDSMAQCVAWLSPRLKQG